MKVGGGVFRSMRTRLCAGFRAERRRAVARPMPEEPPVMTMVLGVDFNVARSMAFGSKSVILEVV